MSVKAVSAIAFAAFAITACTPSSGGPTKHDELERGVLSLSSTAGAGQLLTVGVIQDRTKTTLVRVNARDLSEEATHEAEKLSDAEADPTLVAAKSQAVDIAQQISAVLSDLQVAPTDPDIARDVGRRLSALQDRADRLAERI